MLHNVFAGLSANPGFVELPLADRVAAEHRVRDFILSGVEADARGRFAAISVALSDTDRGILASAVAARGLDGDAAAAERHGDPDLRRTPSVDGAMPFVKSRLEGSLPFDSMFSPIAPPVISGLPLIFR